MTTSNPFGNSSNEFGNCFQDRSSLFSSGQNQNSFLSLLTLFLICRRSEEERTPFARNPTGSLRPFHENDWQSSSFSSWSDLNSPLMPDLFSHPLHPSELDPTSSLQCQFPSLPSFSFDPTPVKPLSPFPHPDLVQPYLPVNYFYPSYPRKQDCPNYPIRKLSPRSSEFIPRKNREREDNCIDIEKVKRGEDKRTTLMIRNIPNGYSYRYALM